MFCKRIYIVKVWKHLAVARCDERGEKKRRKKLNEGTKKKNQREIKSHVFHINKSFYSLRKKKLMLVFVDTINKFADHKLKVAVLKILTLLCR